MLSPWLAVIAVTRLATARHSKTSLGQVCLLQLYDPVEHQEATASSEVVFERRQARPAKQIVTLEWYLASVGIEQELTIVSRDTNEYDCCNYWKW